MDLYGDPSVSSLDGLDDDDSDTKRGTFVQKMFQDVPGTLRHSTVSKLGYPTSQICGTSHAPENTLHVHACCTEKRYLNWSASRGEVVGHRVSKTFFKGLIWMV